MPFRLGFMLRIPVVDEHGCENALRLFDDALTLAIVADDLGFDSLWLTQHHFGSVDSSLPSPLVFLAAVAARTRRIRLGTTVITASLEHPIRLAEDAATLDVISRGRVELGLGTSSSEIEQAAFGVCAGEQRARLHRTALDVRGAFEGHPCGDNPSTVVLPHRPCLGQRMWLATATRAHAAFAATHGFGLITNYRPSSLKVDDAGYLDAYLSECARTGVPPRVAMSRSIFPTESKAAARAALQSHAERYTERGRRLKWLPDSFTCDDYFARDDFHYGHPNEVVQSLARDPGLPYTTELLTGMLSARLSPRELIPVMERIAVDVAPALGWRPAA